MGGPESGEPFTAVTITPKFRKSFNSISTWTRRAGAIMCVWGT